ncbi:MAG: hypothetical protein ABIJ18_01485 [archaeon]
MANNKVILDLCGGTGSWSKPYKDAGYKVHNITLPDYDLTWYYSDKDNLYFWESIKTSSKYNLTVKKKDVYGVLSAPPCTMFSHARTNAKKPRDLREGMKLVKNSLSIIWELQGGIKKDTQKYSPLKFWALENPYHGMLRWFLGEPAFVFSPDEFGHNYQKKTAIWGYFNKPKKTHKRDKGLTKFDYMKSKDIAPEHFGKLTRTERRAITPSGFAKAFMEANL